jgi:glycosyltransferase involved in cell wall biosynthesis
MARFSIITPTRDRPRWLDRSVASVLDQSFADFELVIYDNGTARTTLPDDPRIRYVRGPASGPADAFQRVLELAEGTIVHPLADDDALTPDALATVERELGDHEWLIARTVVEDEHGEVQRMLGGPIDHERFAEEMYLGGAIYWRRAFSDRVGGFDPAFDGAADYDLYLRFAAAAEPKFVDKVLYRHTNHPGTDSRLRNAHQAEQVVKIQTRARAQLGRQSA